MIFSLTCSPKTCCKQVPVKVEFYLHWQTCILCTLGNQLYFSFFLCADNLQKGIIRGSKLEKIFRFSVSAGLIYLFTFVCHCSCLFTSDLELFLYISHTAFKLSLVLMTRLGYKTVIMPVWQHHAIIITIIMILYINNSYSAFSWSGYKVLCHTEIKTRKGGKYKTKSI